MRGQTLMADVFVSYARTDEPVAERVADALRGEGFRVWRDDELPAHRAYADVIEERLKSASGRRRPVVGRSREVAMGPRRGRHGARCRHPGPGDARRDHPAAPLQPDPVRRPAAAGTVSGRAPGWCKLKDSVHALVGTGRAEALTAGREARAQLSICVLPFQNMSGDPEQEYFSDGISEDITTDLSKVSALGVVARNTAFTFKGQSVDVCDVARKLGVSHVLEGSVRKAGDRVRITAQLIDGATGDHVWADRYDRDLTDIFAIQDEISKAIVDALKLKLLPEEKKAIEQRGTNSAEAYNLYLLARQYWVTGNHGDPRREERVMRICSRAVEIDPYYAEAWALLAIAQSNLRYGFGREVDDGLAAAHAALAIDPSIAEAHCAMVKRLEQKGREDEAFAELQKGLRLNPESWELNKATRQLFHIPGESCRGDAALRKGRVGHGDGLSCLGHAHELQVCPRRRRGLARIRKSDAAAGRTGPVAGS